ncbi:hypothetical protein IKE71_03410 [Candidatus Saccharibacteria bacterium]|nr:hypothetical protein [Candidatus Saccharibacteria bacterium]
MFTRNHTIKRILSLAFSFAAGLLALLGTNNAYADELETGGVFSLSPMNQMITLTPGETYNGNFQIINPANNQHEFYYTLEIEPFTTDNDNNIEFVAKDNYSLITEWTTLEKTGGVVYPNENQEVRFSISVPEDAPAGGQYFTIVVKSGEYAVANSSVDLKEVYKASHLIYADIAGETVRKGSMTNVDVPGFLFSGKITGSAAITNEGNVHSQATHTLQVFPLFSSEELFTNEEDPKKSWIMPGNTTVSSVTWEETPNVGIFHVIYDVEYEGVNSNVDKIVIICPLWLLLLIFLAIFLIIFKILWGKKREKK